MVSVGFGVVLPDLGLDAVGGGQSPLHGYVVVEGVDDGCDELAHVGLFIPRTGQKLPRAVVQVRRDEEVKVHRG